MANEGIITLNDLRTRFAAAGVYTVYRDETQAPNIVANQPIRLIVGFSKNAKVFNTPVYIEQNDKQTAKRIFGARDESLERKGSWFHKMLDISLEAGPILAMSLLKLNNETSNGEPTDDADVVEYKSFSIDPAAVNGLNTEKLYASYFDKERFWKPSKAYLLATRGIIDSGKIFNLTNLSQSPMSFIIRKSEVKGFDITVKDWYADEDKDIPSYLREHDYISDYFIDVIAVRGNFGADKYTELAIDPVFGDYFNSNGLIISELDNFLARREVSIVDVYTGCLIPNFRDKDGKNYFIERVINSNTRLTGILAAVDKSELDKFEGGTNTNYMDLVGHRLLGNNVSQVDFLSYKRKITQDFTYDENTSNWTTILANTSGYTADNSTPGIVQVTITDSHPFFGFLHGDNGGFGGVQLGDLVRGETTTVGTAQGITVSEPMLKVSKVSKTSTQIVFELTSPLKDGETVISGSFVDILDNSSSAETQATADFTIDTAGAAGDVLTIKVTDANGDEVTLGSYTVTSGDTQTDVATGIDSAINALTGTTGYSSSPTGADFTITVPSGTFTLPNDYYAITVEIEGGVEVTAPDTFSGGAGNPDGFFYEPQPARFYRDGTNSYYVADVNTDVYADWDSGDLTSGDTVTDGTDTYYLKIEEVKADSGIDTTDDYRDILQITLFADSDLSTAATSGSAFDFGGTYDSNGFPVSDNEKLNFISVVGSVNQKLDVTSTVDAKTVRLAIADESNITNRHFLVGLDTNGNEILTKIKSIKRVNTTHIEIATAETIKLYTSPNGTTQIERYQPVIDFFDNYNLTMLNGFSMKDSHMPDGTNSRMKEIHSVMTDTNVRDALVDPEMSDFRYFIDTFNHGLEPQSKRHLTRIFRDRQTCLGLLNAPSAEEFRDSDDPVFTDAATASDPLPLLKVDHIVTGGNLSENPSFTYSLPEEEDGASFAGFFWSNVKVIEDGDELFVPPAAYVGNRFVAKFRGGNPYLPVAGKNGVLTGDGISGVEYPLTKTERGLLERFGLNPIHARKGSVRIMGNETGYQKFNSFLNSLHIRDTLISIQISNELILDEYTFQYNDDNLKSEVESLLTNNLEGFQDGFGAISSFEIIFDRTNNTNAVLRENAAIVDVIVDFTDVATRFIQRITLRDSDGGVNAGVFVPL